MKAAALWLRTNENPLENVDRCASWRLLIIEGAGEPLLRAQFHLIQDGGASHTAAKTADYFADCRGWWRPRLTPAHASWLNQGELLNHAFRHRYLKRGSWTSREVAHVMASWPEYNRRYAHPFEWTWTNQRMRRWFDEHGP